MRLECIPLVAYKTTGGGHKNPICRVTLSPKLEAEAGLWTISEVEAALNEMEQWTHQLRVKLTIMKSDRRRAYAPRPTPSLKALPLHCLVRN